MHRDSYQVQERMCEGPLDEILSNEQTHDASCQHSEHSHGPTRPMSTEAIASRGPTCAYGMEYQCFAMTFLMVRLFAHYRTLSELLTVHVVCMCVCMSVYVYVYACFAINSRLCTASCIRECSMWVIICCIHVCFVTLCVGM
jgi:hypothetical protein